MRPSSRRVAFLLVFLAVAGGASAAQRKVLVTASVDVGPYTEVWTTEGLLDELRQSLVTTARPLLEQEFQYLAWVDGGDADATLLLSIEEDPKSRRPPGARPWKIRLVLTSGDRTIEGGLLPLAGLDEVSALDADAKRSKEQVVELFKKKEKFPTLFVQATAEAFVREILSEISIADDIDEHDAHVLITVPYDDLNTTKLSILDADFRGAPPRMADLTVGLQLNPLNAYDSRTECAADSTDPAFKNVDQRNLYVENRKQPIRIVMRKYDRDKGSTKEGDRVTEQKQ